MVFWLKQPQVFTQESREFAAGFHLNSLVFLFIVRTLEGKKRRVSGSERKSRARCIRTDKNIERKAREHRYNMFTT